MNCIEMRCCLNYQKSITKIFFALLITSTLLFGCSGNEESEKIDKIRQLSLVELDEYLKPLPLSRQLDLYLDVLYSAKPYDYSVALIVASYGKPAVEGIVAKIRSEQSGCNISELLYIFQLMNQAHGVDFSQDKQLLFELKKIVAAQNKNECRGFSEEILSIISKPLSA